MLIGCIFCVLTADDEDSSIEQKLNRAGLGRLWKQFIS